MAAPSNTLTLNTLPQETAFSLYLELANKIDMLPAPSALQPNEANGVRAIARLIVTCVALPFFAILGTVYNAGVAFIKLAVAIYCHVDQTVVEGHDSQFHATEAFKHAALAVSDFAVYYLYLLIAVGYMFFPEDVNKLNRVVKEMIIQIPQTVLSRL